MSRMIQWSSSRAAICTQNIFLQIGLYDLESCCQGAWKTLISNSSLHFEHTAFTSVNLLGLMVNWIQITSNARKAGLLHPFLMQDQVGRSCSGQKEGVKLPFWPFISRGAVAQEGGDVDSASFRYPHCNLPNPHTYSSIWVLWSWEFIFWASARDGCGGHRTSAGCGSNPILIILQLIPLIRAAHTSLISSDIGSRVNTA